MDDAAQRDARQDRRRWLGRACAVAASCWWPRIARGARRVRQVVNDRRQELNLKGVYVYSFCKFVTWPQAAFANEEAPLVIGILGNDAMAATLSDVASKRPVAQGRNLKIHQLTGVDDATACHLVMITADVPAEQRDALLKRYREAAVLVVTEAPGLGQKGAHVNFFMDGGTVKFEINVPAAQACQLRIAPQLTALKVVRLLGAAATARPN